ncbi:YHYH protein [Aureispira]|nr:YHYH protein [Aureispira sp.]
MSNIKICIKTIVFCILPFLLKAQEPNVTEWILSTGTATYEYYPNWPQNTSTTQTVNMSDSADILQVCSTATDVYIRANGLGSYMMGPWLNPNVPAAQNKTFKFTRFPQPETGTKTPTPKGKIGLALNGIPMFGYGDARSYAFIFNANVSNGDGVWNADAWVSEGATMDQNGNGHSEGTGTYHYHANPGVLYSEIDSIHAPIIGFAFDGYPIYGPFGYSDPNDPQSNVVRLASSYQLRNITVRNTLPNGQAANPSGPNVTTGGNFDLGTYIEDYEYVPSSGDLDEFNGRNCVTPEYPGGTYAYFLTTKSNGDPAFPYFMAAEYFGQVSTSSVGAQAGNSSIPGNAVCGTFTPISHLSSSPKKLILYPNPTEDRITLVVEESGLYNIIIIDALGSIAYSGTKEISELLDLDLSYLKNGLYLIRLTNRNNNQSFLNKILFK